MDFFYVVNNQYIICFGVMVMYYIFIVGCLQVGSDDGVVSFLVGQEFQGVEFGVYVFDEMEFLEVLSVNVGFWFFGFNNDGKMYVGLEFWVVVCYKFLECWVLKLSYVCMYQYLYFIVNVGVVLFIDIWYFFIQCVQLQCFDQVVMGVFYLLGSQYFLNFELYYKWLDN